MDERTKTRERIRQHLERWCHERLCALGQDLDRHGITTRPDWGRVAWEPCLIVEVPWLAGEQTIWCRPVAVRVEDGKAVYRWRFVWGSHDVTGVHAITYPASDTVRAAHSFATLIAEAKPKSAS